MHASPLGADAACPNSYISSKITRIQPVVPLEPAGLFSASIQEVIKATVTGELPEPDMAAHLSIVDAIASGDPDLAASTTRAFMAPILDEIDRLLAS